MTGPSIGLDDTFFNPVEVPLAKVGEERMLLGFLYLLLLFSVLCGPLFYCLCLGLDGPLRKLQGLDYDVLGTSFAPASTIVMASFVPATTRSRSLSAIWA